MIYLSGIYVVRLKLGFPVKDGGFPQALSSILALLWLNISFIPCISRSSDRRCSIRKACNFLKKETLTQVFSCEFCKISKNTLFIEHFRWLLVYIVLSDTHREKCFTQFRTRMASQLLLTFFICLHNQSMHSIIMY